MIAEEIWASQGKRVKLGEGWGLWTGKVIVGSGAGQSGEGQIGWRILMVGLSRGLVSGDISFRINEHKELGDSGIGS